MTDFQQMKQELDKLLQGTEFETTYSYAYVKNEPLNKDTIDSIAIWKKGGTVRDLVSTVNKEKFEVFKAFINTWRQPLVDIREAMNDEINNDVGCTSDVIDGILDQVLDGYTKTSDIELAHENEPYIPEVFADADGCEIEIF